MESPSFGHPKLEVRTQREAILYGRDKAGNSFSGGKSRRNLFGDRRSMVDGEDALNGIRIEPAPAVIRIRQAAREVNGEHVEVLSMGYTDRILVNITTEGKIGHLVKSRLDRANGDFNIAVQYHAYE
jgi:hypothetical protein